MDLNEKLELLRKPDVEGGIEFLREWVSENLPLHRDYISILPSDQVENLAEESVTERLLQKWRHIQKETLYCGFKLHVPHGSTTEYWKMKNENGKFKADFHSNNLNNLIRHTISWIEEHRERMSSDTYNYQMTLDEISATDQLVE